jgi:3-hydroxybutyryl-CoA dehydrogenase
MDTLRDSVVGVVGAGTMGAGIAQVAAFAGHQALLYDAAPGAAQRVASLLGGRMPVGPQPTAVGALADLARADIVVEAVVEDLDVKRRLFAELEQVVTADCVLATNTSSLSPAAIAATATHPRRILGLHFFNPAPAMPLVEILPSPATSDEVVDLVTDLVTTWRKTPVRSTATPGFIVNRIARPFYGEAWRLYEERAADPAAIDRVITGAGGFRMGPFALMDLIGHDVNEAVTRAVWTGFGHDPRFRPSPAQRQLVEAGFLGRKTGRGVYEYTRSLATVAADARKPPIEVVAHGASELRRLLDRSGVAVLGGDGDNGAIPSPRQVDLRAAIGSPAGVRARAPMPSSPGSSGVWPRAVSRQTGRFSAGRRARSRRPGRR